MPQRKAAFQEIRLGALYKFGARGHVGKADLAELMTKRVGLKPSDAEQLAAHWHTTEPYRKRK